MATIGITDVGFATIAANNSQRLTKATAGSSFDVVGMYIYIDPNSPSNQNISVAIYSDNAGVPNALLGEGSISSYPAGAGWKLVLLDAPVSVTNGSDYWLGWWVTDSGNRVKNTGSGSSYVKTVISGFPDWSDPWSDGSTSTAGYSIYGTDVVEVDVNSDREAKILGNAEITSERDSKLTGEVVINETRNAKLTGFGLAELLQDNFNDNSLDTNKWDDSGNSQIAETNSRLEITSTDFSSYIPLRSQSLYILEGSSVSIELVNAGNQSIPSFEAYPIFVEIDGSNQAGFLVTGGNIKTFKKVAGSFSTPTTTAYNPAIHSFFRLRESAGTLYWEVSSNGSTWVELHSESAPIDLSAIYLLVMVGTWQFESVTSTATFDNFNLLLEAVQSERNAALAGGDGKYTETFDTTDKKDEANTTGKWDGDGSATMNTS